MKITIAIILLFTTLSVADPVAESFKSFNLNPIFGGKSTNWTIDGSDAKTVKRGKQTFCNYAGRISIKEAPGGYCPTLTIWHLKTAYGSYDEKKRKKSEV